mgnify:CR=1 FL=1
MAEESTRIVHGPTFKNLLDNVTKLEKQTQKKDLSSDEKSVLAQDLLSCLLDALDMQSEAVMSQSVKEQMSLTIERIVRRFKLLAEQGIACEACLEKLKNSCIYFMRAKHEILAKEIVAVFQPVLVTNSHLRAEGIRKLGMLGCLAMKDGLPEVTIQCANIVVIVSNELTETDADLEQELLQMLQDMAVMAARMRDEARFSAIVSKAVVRYSAESTVYAGSKMVEFLLTLFFTASDRRYVNALPMLRWMSLLLTNNKSLTAGELQYFVREWTQLIAQIARRKWENETRQLMDGLFVFLVREKDFALTRSTLMNIALHFQMYAGWDGFANAFKLYAPWQNFMLVLLDQAVSSRRSQQQREQIGSLVLRTQRDLITAVARLTMQEEMTVYGEWLQFGLSAAKSEKYKRDTFFGKEPQEQLSHTALHNHLYFLHSADKCHCSRTESLPDSRMYLHEMTRHTPALLREHRSSDIPIEGNIHSVPRMPCGCYLKKRILVCLPFYSSYCSISIPTTEQI